ncbi:MAG TPA: hypothetical protein VGL61_09610 [Kofleriaceae bacterium]
MTTPSYKGQNQPAATGGGWLTSLFGGGTPAYASATATAQAATAQTAKPQTATAQAATPQAATPPAATLSRPFFAFAAPAYKLAAARTETVCDESDATPIAIVIPQELDPQQQ